MLMKKDTRLFTRSDCYAAGITTIIALVIYSMTLAPTVTLEQGGAFTVAGQHLGIGRVPGYPVWHLLANAFIKIFGFVRYRGYPNPAWATNFMSAFFGALSCGLVALIVCRVCQAITRQSDKSSANVAAVISGTLFALSHTMWSQSVITETHTLTLFFILLFLTVSIVWINNPSSRTAYALAAIIGIGLAQSHAIILLIPSFLILLLAKPRLFREFCVVNIFFWIAPCVILRLGDISPSYIFACLFSVMIGITLALRLSNHGKTAIIMGFIILLSLSLYLYLPLASERVAPMQFGYARTWEGFYHIITRGQYERIRLCNVLSIHFLEQLRWYLELLMRQFLFPLGLLALLPMTRISRFRGTWLKYWLFLLLNFLIFSVIFLIGLNPKGDIQDSLILRSRFIPSFAIWSIFIGLGFQMILDKFESSKKPE